MFDPTPGRLGSLAFELARAQPEPQSCTYETQETGGLKALSDRARSVDAGLH